MTGRARPAGPTRVREKTTLYAALTALNSVVPNILTVEDPIEYYLPQAVQTQVNNKIGMTFAHGLKAILRQDPDTFVMVKEIRDLETAEMVIQASLTNHLVLIYITYQQCCGVITHLRDMGIERFLLFSTLIGMVAA